MDFSLTEEQTALSETVRRFAWLTDDGERSYRLGRFLEVMTAVMVRRDRSPSRPYAAAVEALYRFAVGPREPEETPVSPAATHDEGHGEGHGEG